MAKQNKQSQPQPQEAAVSSAVDNIGEEAAGNIVSLRTRKGGFLGETAVRISEAAQRKQQTLSEARQRLAEAFDYALAMGEQSKQAEEAADKAAVLLYQGRVNGAISADEVSTVLGETFGWKTTTKGEQSKTPLGMGEVTRKRIVRAVAAHEFVNGGDGGRFFEGLDADEVRPIVDNIGGENGRSIFTVYNLLQDMKKAANEGGTRNPAFSWKAVGKIVDSLSENIPASREAMSKDGRLKAAYAALFQILAVIDEGEEAEAAE